MNKRSQKSKKDALRVLLVEDDHWLAESYARILTAQGFLVQTAAGADEAMRQIDTLAPDVLIVDMLLEEHTAMTLLHELQSYDDTGRIPVIVCSALTGRALNESSLHAYGVRSVLNKATLTPEQLVATVREVCA